MTVKKPPPPATTGELAARVKASIRGPEDTDVDPDAHEEERASKPERLAAPPPEPEPEPPPPPPEPEPSSPVEVAPISGPSRLSRLRVSESIARRHAHGSGPRPPASAPPAPGS